MTIANIEKELVTEIGLSQIQAKVYLLVTCHGKMSADTISEKLEISSNDAKKASLELIELGAFIDITKTEFESMHPRFTAVNMYRRMCQRKGVKFQRNRIVDNIGAVLEDPYYDARTKKHHSNS